MSSYKIETESKTKQTNTQLTGIFPRQLSFCSNMNVCLSEKGDHGRQTDVEMGGQMVAC